MINGRRLFLSTSKILLLLAFVIVAPVGLRAQVWTVLRGWSRSIVSRRGAAFLPV